MYNVAKRIIMKNEISEQTRAELDKCLRAQIMMQLALEYLEDVNLHIEDYQKKAKYWAKITGQFHNSAQNLGAEIVEDWTDKVRVNSDQYGAVCKQVRVIIDDVYLA